MFEMTREWVIDDRFPFRLFKMKYITCMHQWLLSLVWKHDECLYGREKMHFPFCPLLSLCTGPERCNEDIFKMLPCYTTSLRPARTLSSDSPHWLFSQTTKRRKDGGKEWFYLGLVCFCERYFKKSQNIMTTAVFCWRYINAPGQHTCLSALEISWSNK